MANGSHMSSASSSASPTSSASATSTPRTKQPSTMPLKPDSPQVTANFQLAVAPEIIKAEESGLIDMPLSKSDGRGDGKRKGSARGSTSTSHWGPIKSLLALSPVFIIVPFLGFKQHTDLAEPLTDLTNPLTGLPQISETNILNVARILSEEVGYRTVGTYEHALGDQWMYDQAKELKKRCDEIVKEAAGQRRLECEIWRQQGNGNHRFDMMGKRLYKTYRNLTNIVVRLSDGTPEGKEHALLLNSHLDSTLPSPGAADDAISVGVMLECIRVLLETKDWEPKHAVVFLFNNAEESLQDGSHLFSTQHPVADTVRAVINLEAAGSTGRELLFQATSEQMIEAYSHVPRPFGTVFANEVFTSGIILSDTDFRQFEYYLNVTGLDIAVVGNSYLYHMRKDLVENIQPGVGQNMGENALSLITYLTNSPTSPLPSLASGYVRPKTVFFSYLGVFFIYSFETALKLYTLLFLATASFIWKRYQTRYIYARARGGYTISKSIGEKETTNGNGINITSFPESGLFSSFAKDQLKGGVALGAGVVGSLLVPNLVAVVMQHILGKGMSWFANEYSPIVLYAPAAILGGLLSQYLAGPVSERSMISSLLLMQSAIMVFLQYVGIGSAAIFFLSALPLLITMAGNAILFDNCGNGNEEIEEPVSLWVYALGQAFPILTGTLLFMPVLEVFVPLTGRIGADAPAENLIATIVAGLGAQALPLLLPFAHRFGHQSLKRGVIVMALITVFTMGVFVTREPFDGMHQKRLFVLRLENITSHEQSLHLSAADGAPGLEVLVQEISDRFAGGAATARVEPELIVMDDNNVDWEALYPFSAFLTPYKVPLPVEPGYVSPWAQDNAFTVKAIKDVRDLTEGTRDLTLEITHPGLIWTVITFNAHVLAWSLDNNPPDEHARHHIKEASFYGVDSYSIDLKLKISPEDAISDGLLINFVGLEESGMYPAKKKLLTGLTGENAEDSQYTLRGVKSQKKVGKEDGYALRFFEELDDWLTEKTDGTVDALLLGCVAGVTVV